MLMILLSRTATSWPQPTAQYGQTLGTSLTPAMRKRRVSSCAARKSSPRPSSPPRENPAEVRKKSRRLTPGDDVPGDDDMGIVASPDEVMPRTGRRSGTAESYSLLYC